MRIYYFMHDRAAGLCLFGYMQYVWTYVPLSGNYGDAYALASCSDFVFNHAAPPDLQYNSYYGGVMYVNVTVFDRGNGFVSDRFSNAESWLKGCMWLGN